MPKAAIDHGPWFFNGQRNIDGLVERLNQLLQNKTLVRTELDTQLAPYGELRTGYYRLQHPVQLTSDGKKLQIPVGLWIEVPLVPIPGREPAMLDIQGDHVIILIHGIAFGKPYQHHFSITAIEN